MVMMILVQCDCMADQIFKKKTRLVWMNLRVVGKGKKGRGGGVCFGLIDGMYNHDNGV